jgi:hypothetical protein
METEEVEGAQPKFVIDGVEYATYEEAQARIDEKSRTADAKFRDASEARQAAASQYEEAERLRRQAEEAQRFSQPNGQELPDPSTDADGFVTAKIQEALKPYQQAMTQVGAAYQDLQAKYNAIAAKSSGVDVDAVRQRVREKYADEPATASMILASPKLMADQQQIMEAEIYSDDISRLRREKEAAKQRNQIESGASGEGGTGPRVPSPKDFAGMSSEEQQKWFDKAQDDPAIAEAIFSKG